MIRLRSEGTVRPTAAGWPMVVSVAGSAACLLASAPTSPDDLTSRTLYGNFVVLKIGAAVSAHYPHLRNGSVTMRIGQHIRRGTVIGRLGQTGAAGAPYLHFHLGDTARFAQSEGLPNVIDGFARIGHGSIDDMLDPARSVAWRAKGTGAVSRALPLDGDIVRFPG